MKENKSKGRKEKLYYSVNHSMGKEETKGQMVLKECLKRNQGWRRTRETRVKTKEASHFFPASDSSLCLSRCLHLCREPHSIFISPKTTVQSTQTTTRNSLLHPRPFLCRWRSLLTDCLRSQFHLLVLQQSVESYLMATFDVCRDCSSCFIYNPFFR